MVYRSYDQITEVSEASGSPMEVLNNQNPPGLPPHELKLKEGCPIILLRNLEAPLLMNGTRLIVKRLMKNIIVARILTGVAAGEEVLIPRIGLIPSDCFVEFKRVQFPVKPAFCLTCNKAQLGQSYKYAGLHLNLESLAMARCSWGAQDVAARKTSAFTATEQGPKTLSINKPFGESS